MFSSLGGLLYHSLANRMWPRMVVNEARNSCNLQRYPWRLKRRMTWQHQPYFIYVNYVIAPVYTRYKEYVAMNKGSLGIMFS